MRYFMVFMLSLVVLYACQYDVSSALKELDAGSIGTESESKQVEMYGYNAKVEIDRSGDIWISPALRPKYVLPKVGTAYGKSLKIVFDTGQVIDVADTSKDYNTGNMGYRPGGGLNNHPIKNIPTMEVYGLAAELRSTSKITVYYNE